MTSRERAPRPRGGFPTVMGALLLLSVSLQAQASRPASRPEEKKPAFATTPGIHRVVFDERHPSGLLKVQAKRFGWSRRWLKSVNAAEMDIAKESFLVHVPERAARGEVHGLFVWISPGHDGRMLPDWVDALGRQKLVSVGPDKAGNNREIWYRVALALDAVHNVRKSMKIDDTRIYVGGFSGGGRIASRIAVHYGDVFDGGLMMGGANYFRALKVPGNAKREWPARFPSPKGRLARATKKEARHVFLFGEKDFNRAHGRAIFERMKRDGFRHRTWIEIPSIGHAWPPGPWFEKAVKALEAPPKPPGKGPARKGAKRAR